MNSFFFFFNSDLVRPRSSMYGSNMYLLLLVYCNADPGYVIPANEGGRQTERPPGFAQVKLDFIAFLLALN